MDNLGERISYLRKMRGINQRDLMLTLKFDNLSKYEKNIREPKYEILIGLSEFFNVSIDWLLTGKETVLKSNEPNLEECEVLNFYNSCSEEQKNEILQIIKSYMNKDYYKIKKPHHPLTDDEVKILTLFRDLTNRDKIKIEGVIESKLMESKDSKRGESSTCPNSEEGAAKKRA